MPFAESPTRDEAALTSFFENNLKKTLEEAEKLTNEYHVHRSTDAFNITEQIISDLHAADIVIADLSGQPPNPNVMYELGVRLAVSDEPVILIREEHEDNQKVFDVGHFYIRPYNPLDYPELQNWLLDKLSRIETGEDPYESPIARIVERERALRPAWDRFPPEVHRELAMDGLDRRATRRSGRGQDCGIPVFPARPDFIDAHRCTSIMPDTMWMPCAIAEGHHREHHQPAVR